MGLKIIYGDTDSIMVYTGMNKMENAIDLGLKIKNMIN